MFGYIKPCKPEMRIKEFEAYKAVYCGLCRQMGQSFGRWSRMSLSYDFTFLAMLHATANNSAAVVQKARCCVNPLRRVSMSTLPESLTFSANAAMLLLYYKWRDNMQDSSPLRRFALWLLSPLFRSAHKKAARALPQAEEVLCTFMQRQAVLEENNTNSVDAACEPTAQMMSELCGMFAAEDRQKRILERMGYLLGRFVYMCDALDDMEQDIRSGNYNPFVLGFAGKTPTEHDLQQVRSGAKDSLYMTIGELAKAYELLDAVLFGPILENIVYRGLKMNVDLIIAKRSMGKNERSL